MDTDFRRAVSLRPSRKADREALIQRAKGPEDSDGGSISSERFSAEYSLKMLWKKGFIRLLVVAVVIWMLLILSVLLVYIWSCQSSIAFFPVMCNREGKVFIMLDSMGFIPKPPHRCIIPVADDPDAIIIPNQRTPDRIVHNLTYIVEDNVIDNISHSHPLFSGNISWAQREENFRLKPTMKVHCGFMRNGGGDMDPKDLEYAKKCRFVVASGIFDAYDTPRQPSNISTWSQKLFCFLMVVDEKSFNFIKENVTVRLDSDGGHWFGIWRLVLLKNQPYDEPRRNGKIPKIILHRMFPETQYSIWIDGKMDLVVDPLLLLERYLWRGKHTYAIAQHKHNRNVYGEADSIKRRKRYARPLIDLQMKIYRYEGMEPWSPLKSTPSDVPEGAIIIREHTALNNLFSCLWFNEVHLFTPRDQLSFGFVLYRLKDEFKFYMFPNCEYRSIFVLHPHTRKHSSEVEWVKSLDDFEKNSSLKESRGGFGLWTPYPNDLSEVVLPTVVRTSKGG